MSPRHTNTAANTSGTAGNPFGCWAETYTIDPWGNLYQFGLNSTTQSAWVGCVQESGLTTQATTKNQLLNYGYDAAGNLTSVPSVASYTYDAENHLISTAGYTYSYDGDGKRVMKSSGGSGTLYWYGLNDQPLLETSLTGGGLYWYYYFNGRITHRRQGAHFFTPDLYVHDALGNTNLVSTTFPDGWDYSDYYPYGGEWVHQSVVGNHYKFTGKERDAESGLDDFGARYFTSNLGRFMSVDPTFHSQILELPQTWNRYSYVYNRPLFATDPDGRCPPCIGAVVGGIVEGGWNLGSQLYANGGDFRAVSWRQVGANALGGAVTGALAGATGGASLAVDLAAGAASNVVGGIVTRTVEGDATDAGDELGEIATDAVSGFVGGGVGSLASESIHVPEDPGPLPGTRRHAVGHRRLAKYDAAVRARNDALTTRYAVGTAASTPPTHGSAYALSHFWGFFDYLFGPPPPQRPLTPHVTSRLLPCNPNLPTCL